MALIKDRYEPLAVVGYGGEGLVLRALDTQHDRVVAIKQRLVAPDADRARVLGEARVLLDVSPHRGLPLVRDDFFLDDRYCVVMDWIDGVNLAELLSKEGDPGLPFDTVVDHLAEVAAALDHLHAHRPPVVHKDVKPSNVIVADDGRIVLVDFGISSATATVHRDGSAGFVAPEVRSGDPVGSAADVFGLAATAYALLTGAPPEPGAHPTWAGLTGDEARRVEGVLARALAIDPVERPRSAGDLISMLRPPPVANNLPVPLTSFVGRAPDVERVRELLRTSRLLTLTGAAGSGKTRLAVEVASLARSRFADGVWLVELAEIADDELVANHVAATLGVRAPSQGSVSDAVRDWIGDRSVLIVLDNAEHVLDGVARFAEDVLRACARASVVCTSREPLGVTGETVYRVPSLATPAGDDADPMTTGAVALFLDRARAQRPDLDLGAGGAATIARICVRLDGIPLALEIAAAQLARMELEELDAAIAERMGELTGSRTALPRQRTMRSTMDWSYGLLDEHARRVFRHLGVFAGSITAESARAVAGEDAGDLLEGLAHRSLLVPRGEGRYRMLEIVRQYAEEALASAGEAAAARDRHLDHLLAVGRWAKAEMRGAGAAVCARALDEDLANVRAAVAWGNGSGGRPADVITLVSSLGQYLQVRGHWREAVAWLDRALAATPDAPPAVRSEGLRERAQFRVYFGELVEADADARQAVELARAAGDPQLEGAAWATLGNVANMGREISFARECYDRALAFARERGDDLVIAGMLLNIGTLVRRVEGYEAAERHWRDALGFARAAGSDELRAIILGNLGNVARARGDLDEARRLYTEALATAETLGDRRGQALALSTLATIEERSGDDDAAKELYERALTIARDIGDRLREISIITNLGGMAERLGRYEEALALFDEGLAMAEEAGDRYGIGSLTFNRAMVHRALGRIDLAIEGAQRALDLFREIGEATVIAECERTLAELRSEGDRTVT